MLLFSLYRGELTKAFIISELVELTNDEECIVRLAAIETVANLLQLLDDGMFYHQIDRFIHYNCNSLTLFNLNILYA